MSSKQQINCPACLAVLRFGRPHSDLVVVTCPKCDHLFEVNFATTRPDASQPANVKVIQAVAVRAKPMEPVPPEAELVFTVKPIASPGKLSARAARPSSPRPPAVAATLPAPILPPKPAQRSKLHGRNSWLLPATIVAGLAMLCCLGLLAVTASSHSGRTFLARLNPWGMTPERAANQLNSHSKEILRIVQTVDSEAARLPAVTKLNPILRHLAELASAAAQLELVDDQRVTQLTSLLGPCKKNQSDMEVQVASLELDHPYHDPLNATLRRIRLATDATHALLTDSLRTPSEPFHRSEEICREGIVIERRMVDCLASIHSKDDLAVAMPKLHAVIDEFNLKAQEQATSGERISSTPRDYQRIERAAEKARSWFADYLRTEQIAGSEFDSTMQDLAFVQDRFDRALFKEPLANLATTSQQRVQERLALLATSDEPAAGTQQMASATAKTSGSASLPPAASTQGADSLGASLAASMSNSNKFSGQKSSSPAEQPRAGKADVGSRDSSMGSPSVAQMPPPGNNPFSENAGPSTVVGPALANLLSGPNSLTIKISRAKDLDVDSIRDQLARQLNATNASSFKSDEHATLNYAYSGPLAKVASMIDFGTVDLSDTQSRTVFVEASSKK